MDVLAPFCHLSAKTSVNDQISRVIQRYRLVERLSSLCDVSAINLSVCMVNTNEHIWLTSPSKSLGLPSRSPTLAIPIHLRGQVCAHVLATAEQIDARHVAELVAAWLEDLLMIEFELGSIVHEMVHSYEELHLLYDLGGALGGVLDVKAACSLIVQSVLKPLGAAQAMLSLVGHGTEQIMAQAVSSADVLAVCNPQAHAVAILKVNGEPIGKLMIQGKLSAMDFSLGDLKLLHGVAAVSAPAIHNAQLYEVARLEASIDALTGVYNHRSTQQHIDAILDHAHWYGQPVSIIIVEVDQLKLFHDLYGHTTSDIVLQIVSNCIKTIVRESDLVGSYGEERFILILPETDSSGALQLARRILAAIRSREVVVNSDRLSVGLSLGIASFPEHAVTKHDLLTQAVEALNEARMNGGGTIRCAGRVELEPSAPAGEPFSVLQGLVRAVDAKDRYTQEHSNVVTDAALLLAQRLNLPEDTHRALYIAGQLHDIGKIAIPDSVLKKPGRLTPEEYEIMKQHVVVSEMILKGIPQPDGVLDAVAHHHERYDGQGYPYGKQGKAIPLLGRIMAIADAYSTMRIDRPYRKGLSWVQVRAEIEQGSGTQFDPELATLFIDAMEDFLQRESELLPVLEQLV